MAAEMARIVSRLARLVNPASQRVKQPILGKIPLRAINEWLSGDSRIQTLASQLSEAKRTIAAAFLAVAAWLLLSGPGAPHVSALPD